MRKRVKKLKNFQVLWAQKEALIRKEIGDTVKDLIKRRNIYFKFIKIFIKKNKIDPKHDSALVTIDCLEQFLKTLYLFSI